MVIAVDDFLFGVRPAQWVWKPLLKRLVIGSAAPLIMRPAEVSLPSPLKRLGLYLHVPFCHNPCPYCPYNRIKFEESLYRRYESAVHQEIDLFARRLSETLARDGGERPQIVSLYIGGGTPTVVPEGLARVVSHLAEAFGPAGDVCVELHPSAMDDACLEVLKSVGVTMLSIGWRASRTGCWA
jgi:coproporphyrinogen III oxidase-like Fe-S oxidoreductase